MADTGTLADALWQSPVIAPVLRRWAGVGLPDCWLVAGAVAQTVWNRASGFAPDHGLRDIDIIYHDPSDLSDNAEAAHAARIRALFGDLPGVFDVKNEARVHLWYEARFGYRIEPYTSARGAIATFPTTATAIGVRPGPGAERLDIAAPFGIGDLCSMVVRANPVQITRAIYETKVSRWKALWPALDIRPWPEEPD